MQVKNFKEHNMGIILVIGITYVVIKVMEGLKNGE